MKIFKIFLILLLIEIYSNKVHVYKNKYKKLMKLYKKIRKLCDPVEIALKIQAKSVVDHKDYFDYKTFGGGYMNLVLPRDGATIVMN